MGSHDESKPGRRRNQCSKGCNGKTGNTCPFYSRGKCREKRCCPDEDSGFAGFSRYPASGKTGGEGKTAEKHAESRHGEKSCDRNKGVFRNTGNRTGKSTPRNG